MANNEEIEVRKLPKKTIILLIVLTAIIVAGFIFIQITKSMKMEEVLKTLDHPNVSNVKVINKLSVEDKETKVKSTVFKVVFKDNDLNKECIGFVHRSNDGKRYTKDFDCK